jgi:hypothetical protein
VTVLPLSLSLLRLSSSLTVCLPWPLGSSCSRTTSSRGRRQLQESSRTRTPGARKPTLQQWRWCSAGGSSGYLRRAGTRTSCQLPSQSLLLRGQAVGVWGRRLLATPPPSAARQQYSRLFSEIHFEILIQLGGEY